jgi:hypothetical protein
MERIDFQANPKYCEVKTDIKSIDGDSVIDVDAHSFFESDDAVVF